MNLLAPTTLFVESGRNATTLVWTCTVPSAREIGVHLHAVAQEQLRGTARLLAGEVEALAKAALPEAERVGDGDVAAGLRAARQGYWAIGDGCCHEEELKCQHRCDDELCL